MNNHFNENDIPSKKIIELINNYNVKREKIINDPNKELFINRHLDNIYVINLEKNRMRRNYILTVLKKYSINFELIIVPNLTTEEYNIICNPEMVYGQAGCYLSHMFCLNDTIQHNYERIIIFEDDIIIHKNFHTMFENIILKEHYDILMLGASDFDFYKLNYTVNKNDCVTYKSSPNNNYLYGTFAIYYTLYGCNQFFNKKISELTPTIIDYRLAHTYDLILDNYGICLPNLIIADNSSTNICNTFGIQNKKRYLSYTKKCYNNKLILNNYNIITLAIIDEYIYTNSEYFRNNFEKYIQQFRIKYRITSDYKLIDDFFTTDDLLFIILN